MADTYPGIDVSTFQGIISWSQVKADGIRFAMIRSGYGWEDPERQTDARFHDNMEGTRQAGIPVALITTAMPPTENRRKRRRTFF